MTTPTIPGDPYDDRLLSCVRPREWQNPLPAARYNLVVVGAGTAGLIAAAAAAGLGARVALVERDLMGGDCLNVGCVPSKALLRSARTAAQVRDAGRYGVRVPAGWSVDFPAVMERMRSIRAGLSAHDSADRFKGLGVHVFFGVASFAARDAIEVGGKLLRFRRAAIATGARARHPSIPGLAEAGYLTNETTFALTELPQRLAVIGAGPVGCELAQAFARFGSSVTLIGRHPNILPGEDVEAADRVERCFLRDGIALALDTEVVGVEQRVNGKILSLVCRGELRQLEVDTILVGVGRAPQVDGLQLEVAGVAYDGEAGVIVDDYLRTTNPRIYAAGDICSAFKFTHAADAMARILVRNALFRGRAKVSALTIPRCTYTDPEVSRIGPSEAELRRKCIPYRTFTQELSGVDRAVLDGETDGYVKLLVHPTRDTILGATIVASNAGDIIAEVALAMTGKLGLRTVAETIHPYPTQASAIKQIADSYTRSRLTPTVKWFFAKWLAMGR